MRRRRGGMESRLLELSLRLCASADLRQVLASAHELLARSVAADYAALGVTALGRPDEYEWHVAQIPEVYFRSYPEMLEHDFVRQAALRRPNEVLSDEQMVSRAGLHRNPLYVRARELGVRLERVLAVMLDPRASWHGGFILYRDGRLPFSGQEQRELQRAVPLLTGAVHSSRLLQRAETRGDLFESLLRIRGAEVLMVDEQGRELWRTPGLEALLRRHFAPTAAWEQSLPAALAGLLARLLRGQTPRLAARSSWGSLDVTFARLPPGRLWTVLFEDVLPPSWREKLTGREVEVASGVLRGWDNELIASELGCAVATVKKHLQAGFFKLNVPSRAKLIALARDSPES